MSDKWWLSKEADDGYQLFDIGPYESREAALADASHHNATHVAREMDVDGGLLFCPDGPRIIEIMMTDAPCNCPGVADDWLSEVADGEAEELTEPIHALVSDWLKRHGYEATFGMLTDMEEIRRVGEE